MKINYVLNADLTVKSYTIIPFNDELPFIEIASSREIFIGKTKIINGLVVNDFDFNKAIQDLTNPKVKLNYPQLVQKLISSKYSISDEIAILRQKDSKPNEYAEYNAYVENCKKSAKIMEEQE